MAHDSLLALLSVECNKLSHLPFALGALQSLTLLWAGKNRITGVPTSFGRLTNLRSLRLEQVYNMCVCVCMGVGVGVGVGVWVWVWV